MIQTIYKKGPISINHIWYLKDESELGKLNKADAYFLHGVDGINPLGVSLRKKQTTLVSDLTIDKEEAWTKISKNSPETEQTGCGDSSRQPVCNVLLLSFCRRAVGGRLALVLGDGLVQRGDFLRRAVIQRTVFLFAVTFI